MSLIIDSSRAVPAPSASSSPASSPSRAGTWFRVGLAVALVAASAGVRYWQLGRFNEVLRSGRTSPFPLAEMPLQLGPWQGEDDEFDPRIAARTGAVDSIFRTYHNAQTGARVGLILLYGPATEVSIHAPANCYPVSGYSLAAGPTIRPVSLDGEQTVPFEAQTFMRGEAGALELQRVFCSWWYDGSWTPHQAAYKRYERLPGMFKVHVARAAVPGELESERDPCEDFLALLMPELERRLAAAGLAG